jgi:hypothetical protein
MNLTQADLVIFSTLLIVSVLVVMMAVWGIRSRAELEEEGLELNAAEVRKRLGGQLLGPRFMWGVWQKLLSATELRLLLHDETGALVTEVTYFHIPLNGVLQSFTLDGRELQCVKAGVLSGRSVLRDAVTREVLLSCDSGTFRNTIYRGDSNEVVFTIKQGFVWGKSTTIVQNNKDAGLLLSLDETTRYPPVLTMTNPGLPLQAEIFVFLCMRKG